MAVLALVVPVVVALPVTRALAPTPHPVAPKIRAVSVSLSAQSTQLSGHFSEVGATWTGAARVQVRTRDRRGWSAWQTLATDDAGPDDGSKDARAAARATTVATPIWVGPAREVQARGTSRVTLVLIDPGTSAADSQDTGGASASAPQPAIYTRALWGADERLRAYNGSTCLKPDYSATVKVGFVHHTDTPNGYGPGDVPAILRSIYAYHVRTRGWCDVGYNFLVDRFGRIWEGRAGGVTRAVIGAHTGGFNNGSFGAALIGTFSDVAPSGVMLAALERLFAWKLGLSWVNPHGTAWLTSAGGGTSKYKAGVGVQFRTIAGHRDAGYTDCPGQQVYGRLPQIRSAVQSLMGAALTNPLSSRAKTAYGGAATVVTAGVLTTQTWQLTLRRTCDAAVRRTWTGRAATSVSVTVDLHDSLGALLRPGDYALALTSEAGPNRAVPWVTPLEITTTTPVLATQTGTGTPALPAGFVATSPIRVLDTRQGQPLGPGSRVDVQASGVGAIPSAGVQAVAVQLTALCASGATTLTTYPADSARPGTASLSLTAGENSVVLSQVGLSPTGMLSIANAAGYVDVLADVIGYFPLPSTFSQGLHPASGRVWDADVAAGTSVTVPTGVPSSASAVVLNVTAVPTATGALAVAAAGADAATPASLLFNAHRVATNKVVSALVGGSVSLSSTAAAHVIVDVVGYYDAGGALYTALRPARVLNSLAGVGTAKGLLAPGSTRVITFSGLPTDATAVALTLSAASTTDDALTMWTGGPRPATTDLSLLGGRLASGFVVVPLSASGTVSLYNAAGSAAVLGDVVGYYR